MSATRGINSPARQENEFYETPAWATYAMLNELNRQWPRFFSEPPGKILDPGAGSGAITRELRIVYPAADIVAVEIDKRHLKSLRSCADVVQIANYLSRPVSVYGDVDLVFGNPPFTGPKREDLAMKFVQHSMAGAMVTCLLLRLNWLGAQKRHEFFLQHPPYVCVLSRRPNFTPHIPGRHGDSAEYAWMTWGLKDREGTWKVLEI